MFFFFNLLQLNLKYIYIHKVGTHLVIINIIRDMNYNVSDKNFV